MSTINVLTITLNPSIDIAYYIDDFKNHQVNRVREVVKTAGGKGINVSKVLNQLGVFVTATGYVGGYNGELLKSNLDKVGIRHDFVNVPIETRNCISINTDQSTTEILENTDAVDSTYKDILLEKLESYTTLDFVVISGSSVDGIPQSIYLEIIKLFNKKKIPIILDVSPNVLNQVINSSAQVYMIKPNQDEIAPLYANGQYKHPKNVKYVIESRGADGILCHAEDIYQVIAPSINVLSPVGSGDASIAGFIYGIPSGLNHALKCMVASGSANAMEHATGYIQLKHFEALLNKLEVNLYEGPK